MQFTDKTKIYVKAGNGGAGAISFRREAHVEFGGPFGGDGGRGGDVILKGDSGMNTLFKYRFIKRLQAKTGETGGTKKMSGRDAEDIIIPVPVGTVVKDEDTGEVIADVTRAGQEIIIAKGGRGGRGNCRFVSSMNKAPRMNENGDLGDEHWTVFELKVLADVGLLGMPNAGKSTFISSVSNARPEIADYPFTTLSPVLGLVNLKGERQFVCSDIPGLIEGASEGKGLGYEFLKHVERCKVLLHLVSFDEINGDPIENYKTIMNEVAKYKNLSLKPMIMVASKVESDDAREKLEEFKKVTGIKNIYPISSLLDEGLMPVLEEAYTYVERERAEVIKDTTEKTEFREYTIRDSDTESDPLIVTIESPGRFRVESKKVKYWSYKIPLTTKENMMRYNQKLKSLKVEATLKREYGAKTGDTLLAYDHDLQID